MDRTLPYLTCMGLLLLAGCAGYGPGAVRVGQTAGDVAASMGPPTGHPNSTQASPPIAGAVPPA